MFTVTAASYDLFCIKNLKEMRVYRHWNQAPLAEERRAKTGPHLAARPSLNLWPL